MFLFDDVVPRVICGKGMTDSLDDTCRPKFLMMECYTFEIIKYGSFFSFSFIFLKKVEPVIFSAMGYQANTWNFFFKINKVNQV